jgi:hypothetical protein
MFKRFARNLKVENAIHGIDEMLDEIMEIKIDFQDTQSISYLEIQNGASQNQMGNIQQALKAIVEAEKQLNIAKNIFLKQSR